MVHPTAAFTFQLLTIRSSKSKIKLEAKSLKLLCIYSGGACIRYCELELYFPPKICIPKAENKKKEKIKKPNRSAK